MALYKGRRIVGQEECNETFGMTAIEFRLRMTLQKDCEATVEEVDEFLKSREYYLSGNHRDLAIPAFDRWLTEKLM